VAAGFASNSICLKFKSLIIKPELSEILFGAYLTVNQRSHNFPYSFDDAILATKPIPKNNGYQMFQLNGTMKGKNGVFEIGLTKDGIIDHRFFRPIK
jgi:hypothetical protein